MMTVGKLIKKLANLPLDAEFDYDNCSAPFLIVYPAGHFKRVKKYHADRAGKVPCPYDTPGLMEFEEKDFL